MSKYFKMISRAMDQRNEPRLGFARFELVIPNMKATSLILRGKK